MVDMVILIWEMGLFNDCAPQMTEIARPRVEMLCNDDIQHSMIMTKPY